MRALKIIGIIVLVIIVLFFVVALFLPKQIHIESSTTIDRSAALVFKQVNNFQKWPAWSPWEKEDPNLDQYYEGAAIGVGSKYRWESKNLGNGEITILESIPYSKITMLLDFYERGASTLIYSFKEDNGSTLTTWGFDSEAGYPVERFIFALMKGPMKSMFDKGLADLKAVCEQLPETPVIEMVELPEMTVVSILDSSNWSDIGLKMGQMYGELSDFIRKNKLQNTGMPMAVYLRWDEANEFGVWEACLPVNKLAEPSGRVIPKIMPPTKTLKATHFGAYDATAYIYYAMDEHLLEFGLEMNGGIIEIYMNDPVSEPDTAKWQTDIYFPVK